VWRDANCRGWELRLSEKAVMATSIVWAVIQPRLAGLKPGDDRGLFHVEAPHRPAVLRIEWLRSTEGGR
jgi:hypothetical protein